MVAFLPANERNSFRSDRGLKGLDAVMGLSGDIPAHFQQDHDAITEKSWKRAGTLPTTKQAMSLIFIQKEGLRQIGDQLAHYLTIKAVILAY